MALDINGITQDDGFIHIYGDGSYSNKTGLIGVGIVIATKDPERPNTQNYRIQPSEKAGKRHSLSAEFLAVIKALEWAPEGSKVLIHTDHKDEVLPDVDHLIINGQIPPKKYGVIKTLLNKILDLSKKFTRLEIKYAHDKPSKEPSALKRYYMSLAHNAACDASGAEARVKVPDPHAPDTKLKTTLREQHHDASRAMDIIDLGEDDNKSKDHDLDPRYQRPDKNGPRF